MEDKHRLSRIDKSPHAEEIKYLMLAGWTASAIRQVALNQWGEDYPVGTIKWYRWKRLSGKIKELRRPEDILPKLRDEDLLIDAAREKAMLYLVQKEAIKQCKKVVDGSGGSLKQKELAEHQRVALELLESLEETYEKLGITPTQRIVEAMALVVRGQVQRAAPTLEEAFAGMSPVERVEKIRSTAEHFGKMKEYLEEMAQEEEAQAKVVDLTVSDPTAKALGTIRREGGGPALCSNNLSCKTIRRSFSCLGCVVSDSRWRWSG